jgi:urea transport system permease protein
MATSVKRPAPARTLPARLLGSAVLLFLLVFPAIASDYEVGLLGKFLVFGIFALSLDLIWGFSGVVNFGHAIFFGAGAYAMGILLKALPFAGATYVAALGGVLFPALLALGMGYLLFYGRVSGVFFGVVTLALTGAAHSIIIVNGGLTGGMNGLYGYPTPTLGIPGLWEVSWYEANVSYYTAVAGSVGCLALSRWLVKSDFGRAIGAIRENEDRAAFLGYDVPQVKLIIFTIACAMAGLSGVLYVPIGFISPDLIGITMSASVLVWVAVGGRGTLIGAFIGALLVNYLQTLLSDAFVVLWLLLVGLFFILVVLFWPGGIVGLARHEWLKARLQRLGLVAR